MAKESSVAPKERVNITYKPETGDAQEEVELPLKLLVMSDFTLKQDNRRIEDREPIGIDKDNFNDVLRAQNLDLKMNVPDMLSQKTEGGEAGEMAVDLKLETLDDFKPDAIVQHVPELKKLMELREALKSVKAPLGNIPEFRKRVQELVKDEGARERLMKEL
ncbi:MAG TPA: type VI secretion system contractile sheath small subunit, partial [Holophaga sp.]|nr:type VI secretion system contractile sheath small subunit [Holophaga sp.]